MSEQNLGQPVHRHPSIKRYVSVSLLILFLGLSVALQNKVRSTASLMGGKGGLAVKTPAPDFQLKDVEGNTVKLADFRGQVVILDFWATWCGPCRLEFVELKGWVEKRQREGTWEGVELIAVNLKEKPASVAPFVRERKLPFTVVLDEDGSVADQYQIRALPSLLVIDSAGMIRVFQEGYQSGLTYGLDHWLEEIKRERAK